MLNADFRPLSYLPLSLWPWQEAVKAAILERVVVVAEYDTVVRSPSIQFRIPSVVVLKDYVKPARTTAFTRFNLFLRDEFTCQYCGDRDHLTFDHVLPRSRGGRTTWENVVASCGPCNLRKGSTHPQAGRHEPAPQAGPPDPRAAAERRAQVPARTTCTTAGWTTSTGTPSWRRRQAMSSRALLARRPIPKSARLRRTRGSPNGSPGDPKHRG